MESPAAPPPAGTAAEDLSDAQLAGQRLMLGFDGTALNDDLRYVIGSLKAGGLILFAPNLETPDQIRNLCRDAQRYARSCGLPPLLIAIDQEGGAVARLPPPFTVSAGNPEIREDAEAVHFATVTARELVDVGINMNMAPVLDVADPSVDSVMAARAFPGGASQVARLGAVVIEHLQAHGVMAVAKHFPGIGRTVLDSHLDLPFLDTDPRALDAVDFLPFRQAVASGVAGIMLSHIVYRRLDDRWPASLSVRIAGHLLRREFGYRGVVMTDDLDMGAIRGRFSIQEVIRQALAAEIDLLLVCHRGPDRRQAFESVAAGLDDSEDGRRRALAATARILDLKRRFLIPTAC